ncbi:MAG: efflux RND transporter permease subunit [Treponema sp.]|jgi:multidrug efflux pump subunit AcrB|nr:efflux RND transporter permease subunit [Treponema sp.]
MKKLIAACVARPVAVCMGMAALFLAAAFALGALPLNKLPDIPLPRVTVETAYPGMSAAEVRQMVTIPLEDAFSPVKGLEGMESVSRDESSLITLEFRWGIEPEDAAALAREAVDAAFPGMNEGIEKPLVLAGNFAGEPHAVIAVRALSGDGAVERNIADYEIRARLRRIDGTGGVVLSGGEAQEVQVSFDAPALAARGLSSAGLASLLAAETADLPAGSVREGDRELTVVTRGMPSSPEELAALSLPLQNGSFKLEDLGAVKKGMAKRKSLFIYDDKAQTCLEVYRRPGADPVRFSRDIKKTVAEAAALFAGDAELNLVYDASSSIVADLKNLGLSALLAAAAVAVILALFLGNPYYSLLAGLAIPFSAAASVAALALFGRSLNGMSLGGLTMGIGLVSDTAVIVLDTLCAARASGPRGIADAAARVSLSSLAGALTTAVVFIPVIFLPGALGSLYGDLAIALVAAIAAGWLYAQFCLPCLFGLRKGSPVTPLSASVTPRLDRGVSPAPASRPSPKSQVPIPKMTAFYSKALALCMRHPKTLALASLGICVLGGACMLLRPAAFFDGGSGGELEARIEFASLTRIDAALPRGLEAAKALSGLPEIASLYGRMGAETEDRDRRSDPDYRKETLSFRCFLRKGVSAAEAADALRAALADWAGAGGAPVGITVAAPEDYRASLLGLSSGRRLAVRGSGREEVLARRDAACTLLSEALAGTLAEARSRPEGLRPELRVVPRREAAAFAGVSVLDMAQTVYASGEGIVTGMMEIDGRPLDVRLKGRGGTPLAALPLPAAKASETQETAVTLFLGSLGRVERRETEAALARKDRSDVIYLDLIAPPGKEKALSKAAGSLLRRERGSLEARGIGSAGESVFARHKSSLILTMIAVLALLYLTMGAQFESFLLPLILLAAVPFAIAGAGPALFITGSGIDSGSVLALIVLFGLAVNNGIILYESAGEKAASGLTPPEAVFQGAVDRLRPVLITTATTMLALLPMCFTRLGASQAAMARAMVGGVGASCFLSLFVLPGLFVPFLKGIGNWDLGLGRDAGAASTGVKAASYDKDTSGQGAPCPYVIPRLDRGISPSEGAVT